MFFRKTARIRNQNQMLGNKMLLLIEKHATGMTAKGIKAAKQKSLGLRMPPLAKQHRIVAKADALLADALEPVDGPSVQAAAAE